MERKKILFKNIFYIIFALAFASVGFLLFQKPSTASAMDVTTVGTLGDQSLKSRPFFLREDLSNSSAYDNSLINYDTFLYSSSDKNSLRLSFDLNGGDEGTYNNQEIFNYVYYPDLADRSSFQFFSNMNLDVYVNGQVVQDLDASKYIRNDIGLNFEGETLMPETFEIVFGQEDESEHAFSIFDEHGELIEGLYTISLQYTILSTTNGMDDINQISFESETIPADTYSFFVLSRESYLENNRPIIEKGSFDHVIEVENPLQSPDAYLLYSNFSSKQFDSQSKTNGLATGKDQIPFIEFDYLRFEADITKELTTTIRLNIDKLNGADDEEALQLSENSDIHLEINESSHKAKVFFTKIGAYTIALKPIRVLNIETDTQSHETRWQKFNLDGVENITKDITVHLFGYQLNHTNFDEPADENKVRPLAEMKNFDYENDLFTYSADITSKFLNDGTYSQLDNSGTTFVPSKIFDFINKQTENEDGESKYALTPVKTNQTPLRFLANATLQPTMSRIYSTTKVNDTFSAYNAYKLQGQNLYEGAFTGLCENTPGQYVYVICYRYNDFRTTENTPNASQYFRQIFFFEIDKTVPSIEITYEDKAEDGSTVKKIVTKSAYLNQAVTITDTTKNDKFNKEVTVQIYAEDYSSGDNSENREIRWLDGYTSAGISLQNLPKQDGDTDTKHTFLKTENAKYTVRLYYTNEITDAKLDYKTGYGFFREVTFTIDSNEIEEIQARNFQQITGTSKYQYHSTLADDKFSTNQSIALSWREKASGAKTWAYYRYFPLQSGEIGQYYSKTSTSNVNSLLQYMLDQEILPINRVLDLRTNVQKDDGTTETRNWLPYDGNTRDLNANNLDKKYILSDAGLYLVDVYDEAGNHKLDVFMIDNSAPIFAIEDSNGFSFPTSPFINTATTLHWGNQKAIYIAGVTTSLFTDERFSNTMPETSELTDGFFTTRDQKPSLEIYSLIRQLYDAKSVQHLSPTVDSTPTLNGTSNLISSYNGLYLTIKINDTSFYLRKNEDGSESYASQIGVTSKVFEEPLQEMTYVVLIRDESNTKKYTQWGDLVEQQYTSYYSAQQTIIISLDTSRFFIQYQSNEYDENQQPKIEYITSNNADPSDDKETLTTYLSPTRLNKPLSITFRPTDSANHNIQVKEVTIQYYAFKAYPKLIEDADTPEKKTQYWYYAFADDDVEPQPLYTFTGAIDTDTKEIEIRTSSDGFTAPGKYVITRTYMTGDPYMHNSDDYTTRKYVLIVDRNDVVSNQQLVKDQNNKNHNEDLVGGDIFVSMYDSGANADLVVTFPNSEESNTDGTMVYSNNLTTNELPVKLYIPQFKYTTYTEKKIDKDGYEFVVHYDFATGSVHDGKEQKVELNTMNYYNVEKQNLIREYALYAELYKDASPSTNAAPIAVTSTDVTHSPTLDTVMAASNHGFLKFFDYVSHEEFQMIDQPGTYYVRIYQGMFGTGTKENVYTKTFDFSFVVESSSPDFDVTTTARNQHLNAGPAIGNVPTYYTNQSQLNITWNKSRNKYMADIDVTQIKFEPSYGQSFISNLDDGKYYSVNDNQQISHTDIWDNISKDDKYTYSCTLNLQSLPGVYVNGGWVKITMQYKNHNDAFYSTVTKCIAVDLSAPSENVEALVDKALQNSTIEMFNRENLRTYLSANNEPVTDPDRTSYNISTGDENVDNQVGTRRQNIFAYYSYNVTADFLRNNLQNTTDSTAYVRSWKVGDLNTKYTSETKETDPRMFDESTFELASNMTSLETDTYYEIVEMDRARNMAIYTIYVTDQHAQQNILTYVNDENEEKHYTTADYERVNSRAGAIHNIFARTGFKLRGINFFGDEWARMRLTTWSFDENGDPKSSTINLMMTPYDKTDVYVFANDTNTATQVPISSLIDGNQSIAQKHSLEIFNRLDPANSPTFYFNIYDTPLSPLPTSTSTREMLSFTHVTDAEIQNRELSTRPFVVEMKITVDGRVVYSDGVDENENPLPVQNPMGYASLWKNFTQNPSAQWETDEFVRVFVSGNQLCFEINPNYPSSRNSRVEYEFTDNYGFTQTETHIFREAVIGQEVTAINEITDPLYAYYENSVKLVYIAQKGLRYNFNASKYHVVLKEIVLEGQSTQRIDPTSAYSDDPTTSGGITTWAIHTSRNSSDQYHDEFVLELYDELKFEENGYSIEGLKAKKEVYFYLNDQLPREDLTSTRPGSGKFQIRDVNGKIIDSNDLVSGAQGYYSQVRITYTPSENEMFIPVKYMYRSEDSDWRELISGTRLQNLSGGLEKYYLKIWYDEQYLKNELGNGAYVFERVPESQIFEFSLSSLTSNYWVEKTENGVTSIVEKAEQGFKSPDGKEQHSNHYIVNVPVGSVTIRTNNEQQIEGWDAPAGTPWRYNVNGQEVVSEKYILTNRAAAEEANIPVFETIIVITYIPNAANFLTSFFTLDVNGSVNTGENLVNSNTPEKMLVVPEGFAMDRTQLIWSKYFVIPENTISIDIKLGDRVLSPEVYSKTVQNVECNYIYLTYSGLYTIQFKDTSGNIQKFARKDANGNTLEEVDTFEFIFLKDVPFTVTYINPETSEEVTDLPIKRAIYNDSVTLKLDRATLSRFYRSDGYPSFWKTEETTSDEGTTTTTKTWLVKRNGEEYQKDFESSTEFTFDQPGYYELSFAATSILSTDGGSIRQEVYQFTIINSQEYKFSHVFNKYGNYYVEKVVKDGQDVTDELVEALKDSVQTIFVPIRVPVLDTNGLPMLDENGEQIYQSITKEYLTQLPLSYLDTKTGLGEYLITININTNLYNSNDMTQRFTYKVLINSGDAPLRISLEEGKSTTGTITIRYNLSNLFMEMGESTLRIVRLMDNGMVVTNSISINESTTGESSLAISTSGTYFIQVLSPSGNLLFTYKVIRNEPLNAAAIIAIVVAAIVLVAVIIIIIKLRKRISVK